MKPTTLSFVLFGVIILVLTIFAGWLYFSFSRKGGEEIPLDKSLMQSPPQSPQRGEREGWFEYKRPDFGFSFLHPPLLKASSRGPNIAQQQIEAGEMISGTIPPSFDTVLFVDNENKEWFRAEIFHKLQIPLTPDMIYYQCDNQFNGGKQKVVNQIRTIDGVPILERKTFLSDHGKWNYFYCFQNLRDNLIVISATSLSEERTQEIDMLLVQILETVTRFQIIKNPTVSNSTNDFRGNNNLESVGITWTPEFDAAEYILFRSDTITGPFVKIGRIPADPNGGTNAEDLTPDTKIKTLCYKLEARDNAGRTIRIYEPICIPPWQK